jgi:hypothetical protein
MDTARRLHRPDQPLAAGIKATFVRKGLAQQVICRGFGSIETFEGPRQLPHDAAWLMPDRNSVPVRVSLNHACDEIAVKPTPGLETQDG